MQEEYESVLEQVRQILGGDGVTRPAHSSKCSLCHWRSRCWKDLVESDDPSLIFYVGGTTRDKLLGRFETVRELAEASLDELVLEGKSLIAGIGAKSLLQYQERARLLAVTGSSPILRLPFAPPANERELFYDVETDTMRDVCYLHGFVVRTGGDVGTEEYVSFFADDPTPEAEEEAFQGAWSLIQKSQPCTIYIYSKYERTTLLALATKYPNVADPAVIQTLFEQPEVVDLYFDVILPYTEWPTSSYGIKAIATYLGFEWRDPEPSGAASIRWYHDWVDGRLEEIKQRILEYNEDDCLAMRVLTDSLVELSARKHSAG